jgi:hypothetical protein
MRVWKTVAVAGWLAFAPWATAQVPRDPLADAASSAGKTSREQAPPYVTRQSEVEIPFTVRPGTTPETQPTAVRIFVSWDSGKSWHFYEERRAEEGRFRFRPRQDGEFWFATQTIDRAGRPDSQQPKTPQLRLVVDTQRPQLLVQSQVDGSGNVHLSWAAGDPNLMAASLKVEYQDAGPASGTWETVELRPTAAASAAAQVSGQTMFHPNVAGQAINLRAEIADAAGNVAYYSQRLSLLPPKPAAGGLAAGPAADPSATRWPTNNQTAIAGISPPPVSGVGGETQSSQNEQVQIPNLVSNPFIGPGRLASVPALPKVSENLPLPATASSANLPPQDALPPPAASTPAVVSPANESPPAQPVPSVPTPSAPPPVANTNITPTPWPADNQSRSTTSEIMPAPRNSESVDPPLGQRPRLTNSKRFSLDYDIQTVGPEGVASVELWGTTDGGRTWAKWGADPDKTSPFDVEVNHEAQYGFRIAIVGKNGLATSTPQPGDAADICVGIDLTRPKARLSSATYGQGQAAGKLEIRWEANDLNLGSRPITLSMSDRPEGPFTPIAAGLPNTGLYYWEYDPRSPRQIYLRLEVRDEAGNIGIDQLTEPIKVEGLEPKGQIRGFNPGPEEVRGAFRTPLFR